MIDAMESLREIAAGVEFMGVTERDPLGVIVIELHEGDALSIESDMPDDSVRSILGSILAQAF